MVNTPGVPVFMSRQTKYDAEGRPLAGRDTEIKVELLPTFEYERAATVEVAKVQLVPTTKITDRTVLELSSIPVIEIEVLAPNVPLSKVRGVNEVGPMAIKNPDPALKYVEFEPPK